MRKCINYLTFSYVNFFDYIWSQTLYRVADASQESDVYLWKDCLWVRWLLLPIYPGHPADQDCKQGLTNNISFMPGIHTANDYPLLCDIHWKYIFYQTQILTVWGKLSSHVTDVRHQIGSCLWMDCLCGRWLLVNVNQMNNVEWLNAMTEINVHKAIWHHYTTMSLQ